LSVNVGDRTQSKIEVVYQAIKLRESLSSLSLRSFGVRSRNSILRRKYEHAIHLEGRLDTTEELIKMGSELGLHINKSKTHIVKLSSTYKFLQVRYTLTKTGKVIKRINPKRVTTMRKRLKKLAVKVKNGEIEYENVENTFRSWMGSFYKLLSNDQRHHLISLYEWLFDKKVTIMRNKTYIISSSEANLSENKIEKFPRLEF